VAELNSHATITKLNKTDTPFVYDFEWGEAVVNQASPAKKKKGGNNKKKKKKTKRTVDNIPVVSKEQDALHATPVSATATPVGTPNEGNNMVQVMQAHGIGQHSDMGTDTEDDEKNSYFQNLGNQFYADANNNSNNTPVATKTSPKANKNESNNNNTAPAATKKNEKTGKNSAASKQAKHLSKELDIEADASKIQKELEALKKDGGEQWLIILNEYMQNNTSVQP